MQPTRTDVEQHLYSTTPYFLSRLISFHFISVCFYSNQCSFHVFLFSAFIVAWNLSQIILFHSHNELLCVRERASLSPFYCVKSFGEKCQYSPQPDEPFMVALPVNNKLERSHAQCTHHTHTRTFALNNVKIKGAKKNPKPWGPNTACTNWNEFKCLQISCINVC